MSLVPEGYYNAVPVKFPNDNGQEVNAVFGKAATGTKQIGMMFMLVDGDYEGARISWRGSFTKKSYERTLESLRHCGFKGDDLSQINSQELTNPVRVTVEHDTYNEKTYARIAWVNGNGGAVTFKDALSDQELREFAAQMRAKLKTMPEIAPPPSSEAFGGDPGDPGLIDDDIPF